MAGKVIDVTLRLVDQLTSPLNLAGKSLAKHASQFTMAGAQIQKAGRSISDAGMKLTKSLTLPIVGAGVACVKLASDFEAGMSKVQSISGATASELDKLSEKAKEMGAKTKFSASQATEAYQYMAMAGWKTTDMLNGIEPIMKLAGATGEDLASTSDIVTDALTAFGKTAKDSAQLTDILASTASNANTDVAKLGESFKYCAPVAGALGYSMADTSKALGLMANSGIKASQAGTSLRSWLTNMSAPTAGVEKAMTKLGISMTDSSGKMKSLDEVMIETRGAFDKLSESQKAQYAKLLAGKAGMSGLLAVVNGSDKDFDKLTDAINRSNGACQEMYDVANDNLQGQLTILKSTIQSLAIDIGERLVPYVKKAVEWLQGLAEKFNGLSDAQKDTVVKIALVVASIGPAIAVFGKLTTGIGKAISFVGKIGMAFKKFGSIAGMLTSPVGIVILVLGLLALGIYEVIKHWDQIKPVFAKTAKALQPARDAIHQLWTTVKNTFGPLISFFKNQMLKAVQESMKKISDAIGGARDPIKSFAGVVNKMVKSVCEVLGKITKALAPVVKVMIKNFAKAIPKAVGFLVKAVKTILPPIKRVVGAGLDLLLHILQKLIKVFTKIGGVIKKNFTDTFKKCQPTIKKVTNTVKSLANTISKVLTKVIEKMKPVLDKLLNKFTSVFSKMSTKLSGFYQKVAPIVGKVTAVLGKVVEFLVNVLGPVFSIVFETIGSVVGTAFDFIGGVFDSIIDIFGGIIDFITGVFSGNWSKAWDGIVEIFKGIFNLIPTIVETIINLAIGIVNGIISGINALTGTIGIPEIPKIPEVSIPRLAKGTDDWKGGIVQVSERGGEIIDLPDHSRVYPHDKSVDMARKQGQKEGASRVGGGGSINVTIPKLADSLVIRSDQDIDAIAQKLADKLEKVSQNLGGGEIGYIY